MKLIKKLMFFILTFFLVFSPLAIASNEPVVTSDNPSKSGQTIKVFNTDLYLGGQDVVVGDAVNGNIFAFGSTVTIKGEILGDIFVLAKELTIDEAATIHGNVFAFANNIIIKGKVNYDVYSCGQNFELADTAYINRDIKLLVANVNLYGSVKKDAYLFVDTILMAENSENIIGGNLHYTSDKEFKFPEKAIMGNVKYTEYKEHHLTAGEVILKYVKKFISDISLAIIIILLAVFLAPKFITQINYALMKRPFVSAGIGVLAIVLIPVIAFFFLISGFLTALSIVTIVVYGLILAFSLAFFSLAIAKSMTEKFKEVSKGKFILASILSAIALWIVQLIPVLGTYVSLFIHVVGLGIFLTSFVKAKEN